MSEISIARLLEVVQKRYSLHMYLIILIQCHKVRLFVHVDSEQTACVLMGWLADFYQWHLAKAPWTACLFESVYLILTIIMCKSVNHCVGTSGPAAIEREIKLLLVALNGDCFALC